MKFPEAIRDVPTQSKIQVRASLAAWVHVTHARPSKKLAAFIQSRSLSPKQVIHYLPLAAIVSGVAASLIYLAAESLTGSKSFGILAALLASMALSALFTSRGTLATLLVLLAKWQLLILLPSHLIVGSLIAAQAFACFAAYAFLYTHKPTMPAMKERHEAFAGTQLGDRDFILMTAFGMLPIALLGQLVFVALLPVLWIIRALLGFYLVHHRQHYTSHTLTLVQHSLEVGFYLGVATLVHMTAVV